MLLYYPDQLAALQVSAQHSLETAVDTHVQGAESAGGGGGTRVILTGCKENPG